MNEAHTVELMISWKILAQVLINETPAYKVKRNSAKRGSQSHSEGKLDKWHAYQN